MSEEADMIEQTTIAEEQKILDYVKPFLIPTSAVKKESDHEECISNRFG